jgi:hypothetical protein
MNDELRWQKAITDPTKALHEWIDKNPEIAHEMKMELMNIVHEIKTEVLKDCYRMAKQTIKDFPNREKKK